MHNVVLVVAAHADDEALGCGGAIARHVSEMDTVYVLNVADGVSSRVEDGSNLKASFDRRERAAASAAKVLGLSARWSLGFPDNKLDTVARLDVIQQIELVVRKILPTIVYTHHGNDLNVDHRVTHEAVMTACRPLPGASVREIYGFEVVSSTEWSLTTASPFRPAYFVDISDFLGDKLSAIGAYEEEMRTTPHSRSIEHVTALAQHRGYSVGMHAAEAFEVYRIIRE